MKKLSYLLIAVCACTSLPCLAASQTVEDQDEVDTTDVLAIPLDTSADEEEQENATLKKMEQKEQKEKKQ